MKTTKMIVGIISIVLSVLVTFQSCAAGAYNAMTSNGESSGTAGLFVAILMLVAGIIGIAARKSKGGSFTAMAFYILSGIIGLAGAGSYKDLTVWGVVCLIFAVIFLLTTVLDKSNA